MFKPKRSALLCVAAALAMLAMVVLSACSVRSEASEPEGGSSVTVSQGDATSGASTTAAQTASAQPPEQADTTPAQTAATTKPATTTTTAITTTTATTTTTAPPVTTATVTIPEGYSFAQIAKLMEDKGICTAQAFLDTVNTYDFSYYPLVALIPDDENRCFTLEGYLFPDTYEFYLDEKPENVLGKLLRHGDTVLGEAYRTRAAALGLTMDEVLTLASIVEKETGKQSEMANIASVLYNRLEIGRSLECDSTILYVENYIKPYIGGDVNRFNSYYNTYKCDALPAGPICSPGMDAIEAALYPADTDYLFFVSDAQGKYYYASNGTDHKANCALAGVEWAGE